MNKYLWSVVESGTTVLFQFLSLIILSRLLTPVDYGVFGAMALFISIGTMLADSGMGGSLVKKEDPTTIDYSTLFCFNFGVSIIYYLFLILVSSLIASFYHIEALSACIKVYGIYVIIAALGLVQNVQLNRDLRLKELAIVTLISNFIGLVVAIALGFWGYGYWSLIYQHLVFITCRVIFQFLYNRYIPSFRFSVASFKEQFGYSVYILGSNLLHVLYSNVVSVIIPKIGTLQQNGFYLQASRMQNIPMTIASGVMDKVLFPVLCRNQGKDFLGVARKQIYHISWIASAAILSILLLSDSLITLLLGKEWMTTANYLKVLLLASYGMVYQYIVKSLFKAIGITKQIFKINIIQNVLGISSVLAASYWGIDMLLWGLVAVNLFVTAFHAWQVRQSLGYGIRCQLMDNLWMIILFVCSLIMVVI